MTRTNTRLIAPLGVNNTPFDYMVSTALTSSLLSGTLNYQRVKSGDLNKDEAIKNTIKLSSQASIASGSAIAAIQYASNKKYLNSFLSVAVGVISVMAIEKISENSKKLNEG